MKITRIESHEALAPYHDFNALALRRYHGRQVQLRTVYIVHTDRGLEGCGECWGPGPAAETFGRYIGTSPLDWLGARQDLPMNMAIYDLAGKHLGVPAWKLIGPRVRAWTPVAAWTVAQEPAAMAEEARRAAARGYRWLKFHVGEIQNVIDQTAAMQAAAPAGFRVHYDFNANQTFHEVLPVLAELANFAIAGCIEDPIIPADRDGWRRLRGQTRLPVLAHHAPLEFLTARLCDGYIPGHAPLGEAIRAAAVAEALGAGLLIQNCGGTINRAFLAHEAAVFPAATLPHVDLCDLWKDDVTAETLPVVGGLVAVPDRPGLGVTLDRAKLERYAAAAREDRAQARVDRFLVRTRYRDGLTIYCRHDPDQPSGVDSLRFRARLHGPGVPGPAASYASPVISDFWAAPGAPEFERLWAETASGPVWRPATSG